MPAAPLKVRATQMGYFGFEIRPEGAKFVLNSVEEFSHDWMVAIGWTPPKRPLPGAAGPSIEEGDAVPEQFRGAKPSYGEDDIEIGLSEAIDRAIDDGDLSVDQWNKLADKERNKRTMAAVKVLIEEARELREDGGGEEDDDEEFEEDEDEAEQ